MNDNRPLNPVIKNIRQFLTISCLFAGLILCLAVMSDHAHAADGDEETTPATETSNQPEVLAPVTMEQLNQYDLKHYLPDDEIKPLMAGDTEFYTLNRDDTTGRTKGVVVFIPDWSGSITSPRGINYLRKAMNDYGWVTMSVGVPDKLPARQPEIMLTNTDSSEPTDEQAANESNSTEMAEMAKTGLKPPVAAATQSNQNEVQVSDNFYSQYQQALQIRLSSIRQEAENYPGFFIVVAQGSSAAAVTRLFAEQSAESPDALILLSAWLPERNLNLQFNQDIANTTMPVLDVYQSQDAAWITANLHRRKQQVRKHFKAHYRQRELFGTTGYQRQNQRLFKEIYGWLTTMGI